MKCRSWALGGRGNRLEKQSGSHSLDRAIFHKQGEDGSQEPQTSALLLKPNKSDIMTIRQKSKQSQRGSFLAQSHSVCQCHQTQWVHLLVRVKRNRTPK